MATILKITPKTVYQRVNEKRKEAKLTWNQLAKKAGIPVSSAMTGVPYATFTDEELEKMAPVLNTTFNYLKYGTEDI